MNKNNTCRPDYSPARQVLLVTKMVAFLMLITLISINHPHRNRQRFFRIGTCGDTVPVKMVKIAQCPRVFGLYKFALKPSLYPFAFVLAAYPYPASLSPPLPPMSRGLASIHLHKWGRAVIVVAGKSQKFQAIASSLPTVPSL